MTVTTRKVLRAAIAAVSIVAVAIPLVMSGTASAQRGSRLCGRYWMHTDLAGIREVVANLYEVPINHDPVCDMAKKESHDPSPGGPRSPKEGPFWDDVMNKDDQTWHGEGFAYVICEDWKTRALEWGGLENLPLHFWGDNWPHVKDQFDICDNMNRSDTIFDMQSYWTYQNGVWPVVQFERS